MQFSHVCMPTRREFCRAENLTPSQRELLMVQGLWSRVATMENHYFHYDEVWHALYSRAEQRHLMDPENPDFKDDDSQQRQVKLFRSIMRSAGKEVRRKIAATVSAGSPSARDSCSSAPVCVCTCRLRRSTWTPPCQS
eukprot:COSAG05_NODE_997_length_6251_cov_6.113622_2_plen_138_part_00